GRLADVRARDVPRPQEGGERAPIRYDLVRLRGHVRDVVERVRRTGGIRDPLALADVGPRDVLERGDATTLAADAHLLQRGRAITRGDVLLFPSQDAPGRTTELHREERRDDRVLTHAAFGAEAATHVIAQHADLGERKLQRRAKPLPHAEDVLGGLVDG